MGIPYSKQINLAFEQVTPLVAAGFEILQTTKNITFLLAAIQILTALFLGLIFLSLIALIITTSPDLEYERRELVTPVVKWIAGKVLGYGAWMKVVIWVLLVGIGMGALVGWWIDTEIKVVGEAGGEEGDGDGDEKYDGTGT